MDAKSQLSYTPTSADLRIKGDPVQLQQVILNLIINAMDAITEAGPRKREIGVIDEPLQRLRGNPGWRHRPRHRSGEFQEGLRSVFHDQAAGHGYGACHCPHHCRSASRQDFGGEPAVRWRAVHDQAANRARPISFGLIQAGRAALLDFLDLYQGTTRPRTDACGVELRRRA